MANNPKAIENLKPRKKGEPTLNPTGRRGKTLTAFADALKKQGYAEPTSKEIITCIKMLIGLPENEVRKIAHDIELPIMVTVIAKKLLDLDYGSRELSALIDRILGKASQSIQLTGDAEKPIIQEIKITIVK